MSKLYLTEAQSKRIAQLYKDGLPTNIIAIRMGVHVHTVRTHIKKAKAAAVVAK